MKTGILIGYFEPLHLGHLADINHATGQTDTLHVVILPKDGDSLFKPTLQDKARAVQVACGFFDFVKVHTAQSLNLTDLHGQAWAYDEPNSDTSVISLIINALHIYDNPTLFVKQSFANNLLSNTPLTIQTQQMTPLPNNAYNSIAIYQNPITHFHAIAPSAKQTNKTTPKPSVSSVAKVLAKPHLCINLPIIMAHILSQKWDGFIPIVIWVVQKLSCNTAIIPSLPISIIWQCKTP